MNQLLLKNLSRKQHFHELLYKASQRHCAKLLDTMTKDARIPLFKHSLAYASGYLIAGFPLVVAQPLCATPCSQCLCVPSLLPLLFLRFVALRAVDPLAEHQRGREEGDDGDSGDQTTDGQANRGVDQDQR